MATKKIRLDILLHERGLAPTRTKAQALIMAGEVLVDGVLVDKPGTKLAEDVLIEVKEQPLFVSRGGEKLAGALVDFGYDVTGKIAADVGASTGGFTDCLLQNNVGKVYAIDVGYGQIAHKLRVDERIIMMERTNARHLQALAEPVNLVVIDASFISLKIILPAVRRWLTPQADVIALIKPQFEAGKAEVSRGGVVRDSRIHKRVIADIADFAESLGFVIAGLTVSPIKGAKEGNTEFLIWLALGQPDITPVALTSTIKDAINRA